MSAAWARGLNLVGFQSSCSGILLPIRSDNCADLESGLLSMHYSPQVEVTPRVLSPESAALSVQAQRPILSKGQGRSPCDERRRLLLALGVILTGRLTRPGLARADPPPPVPTTEVPAAVNAVNTEENAQLQQSKDVSQTQDSSAKKASKQVSLELARDGDPLGRIVISVFGEPPLGSQRFLELAQRSAGGYRLSKVDGISEDFITFSGVLQQNYVGIPTLPGGETVEQIEAEQALYPQSHDKAGLVSLIVEDAGPKDVRDKLVAYKGKFIKVQEVRGASNANATGFAITLGECPLLDKTNLVVGQVVEGLDVVQQISGLPRVKSSSSSPFFKVAKALGDRRADVAARSFGKPIGKIIIEKISVS